MISDLSIIENGQIKRSLEKLLKVREEMSETEEKIIFQRDEMMKTKKMIEQYEEYYDTQLKAFGHFCAEKERLNLEQQKLILEVNSFQFEETSKYSDKSRTNMVCDIDEKLVNVSDRNDTSKEIDNENIIVINNEIIAVKNETLEDVKKEASSIISTPKEIRKQNKKNQLCITQKTNKKLESNDILRKLRKDDKNCFLKKVRKEGPYTNDKTNTVSLDTFVAHESITTDKNSISSNSKIKLKISTKPLIKLLSIDVNHKIHKILFEKDEILLCGSRGLLCLKSEFHIINYLGHDDYYVYNMYKYKDIIVSLGFDYILVHSKKNPNNHRMISKFSKKINCTCLYKSEIYGALEDGEMFSIDLENEKINYSGYTFSTISKAMVIVESSIDILNLVVGIYNGDVVRCNVKEDRLHCIDIGKVDDKLKGIVTDGNIIVCYTDHKLYLISKDTWKLTLIRQMANSICFVDMCLSKIVVIDNCNIIHKYIIKKGVISLGSTVESLTMTTKVSALQVCGKEKKVFIASQSDVFSKKL